MLGSKTAYRVRSRWRALRRSRSDAPVKTTTLSSFAYSSQESEASAPGPLQSANKDVGDINDSDCSYDEVCNRPDKTEDAECDEVKIIP